MSMEIGTLKSTAERGGRLVSKPAPLYKKTDAGREERERHGASLRFVLPGGEKNECGIAITLLTREGVGCGCGRRWRKDENDEEAISREWRIGIVERFVSRIVRPCVGA